MGTKGEKERQPVRVHLVSHQSDGVNRETVKVEGKGQWWETDGICFLNYKSEGPAEGALHQQIELWPGRTVVKNYGAQQSRMTFRVGERLQADYHTPYGPLPIETQTKKHWVKREATGLSLLLEYTLFLDGERLADYRMEIVVEKEE